MAKQDVEPIEGLRALPAFPVVLVTVQENVMTAAAFHFFSFNPLSVMVGIRPQTHTFSLIPQVKEFGINIPTTTQLEQVRVCGSVSARDEDKFEKTGLTKMKGKVIDTVLVAECPVNLECRVVHEVEFEGSHRWFVGEIVAAHIAEDYQREQALMYWMREYRSVGEVLLSVKGQ
jgi:flavin reductase (DIM6/NTAB) family NADH-FMN oxidoreductase RutF